ncbi:MAG: sigma factor-like helix-turn-helix DNA-binding protein, partial [Oscillospiraceae bacterium]
MQYKKSTTLLADFSQIQNNQSVFDRSISNVEQRKQLKRFLSVSMKTLTKKQQEVIYLYYFKQMNCSEIAASLLLSTSTITRRLIRARDHL